MNKCINKFTLSTFHGGRATAVVGTDREIRARILRFSLWSSKTGIREVFRHSGELQNAVSHANSEGDQSAFIKTVTNVYMCYGKTHLLNTRHRYNFENLLSWRILRLRLHITVSCACHL